MTTDDMITAVREAIETELTKVSDNEIYDGYRARNVANYCQALRHLVEVKRTEVYS